MIILLQRLVLLARRKDRDLRCLSVVALDCGEKAVPEGAARSAEADEPQSGAT